MACCATTGDMACVRCGGLYLSRAGPDDARWSVLSQEWESRGTMSTDSLSFSPDGAALIRRTNETVDLWDVACCKLVLRWHTMFAVWQQVGERLYVITCSPVPDIRKFELVRRVDGCPEPRLLNCRTPENASMVLTAGKSVQNRT